MDFVLPVFVDQVVPLPCLNRSLDHNCVLHDLILLALLSKLIKLKVNLNWLCITERLSSTVHHCQYFVFFNFESLILRLVVLPKSCFAPHVLVQRSFQADS